MLISIDPGKSGAWAVFDDEGNIEFTGKFKVAKGQRFFKVSDLDELNDALSFMDEEANNVPVAVMEEMLEQRMSHQSPKATNTTAANWGMIHLMCQAFDPELYTVRATDWKRRMGLYKKDKKASVALAIDLVGVDHLLKPRMRVPNEDIAEAVLIGIDHGIQNLGWKYDITS